MNTMFRHGDHEMNVGGSRIPMDDGTLWRNWQIRITQWWYNRKMDGWNEFVARVGGTKKWGVELEKWWVFEVFLVMMGGRQLSLRNMSMNLNIVGLHNYMLLLKSKLVAQK